MLASLPSPSSPRRSLPLLTPLGSELLSGQDDFLPQHRRVVHQLGERAQVVLRVEELDRDARLRVETHAEVHE